jgi:hypothetical protein
LAISSPQQTCWTGSDAMLEIECSIVNIAAFSD